MKLGQNILLDDQTQVSVKMGLVGSKSWSLGQILEKPYVLLYHTIWKAQVSDSTAIVALLFSIDLTKHNSEFD